MTTSTVDPASERGIGLIDCDGKCADCGSFRVCYPKVTFRAYLVYYDKEGNRIIRKEIELPLNLR